MEFDNLLIERQLGYNKRALYGGSRFDEFLEREPVPGRGRHKNQSAHVHFESFDEQQQQPRPPQSRSPRPQRLADRGRGIPLENGNGRHYEVSIRSVTPNRGKYKENAPKNPTRALKNWSSVESDDRNHLKPQQAPKSQGARKHAHFYSRKDSEEQLAKWQQQDLDERPIRPQQQQQSSRPKSENQNLEIPERKPVNSAKIGENVQKVQKIDAIEESAIRDEIRKSSAIHSNNSEAISKIIQGEPEKIGEIPTLNGKNGAAPYGNGAQNHQKHHEDSGTGTTPTEDEDNSDASVEVLEEEAQSDVSEPVMRLVKKKPGKKQELAAIRTEFDDLLDELAKPTIPKEDASNLIKRMTSRLLTMKTPQLSRSLKLHLTAISRFLDTKEGLEHFRALIERLNPRKLVYVPDLSAPVTRLLELEKPRIVVEAREGFGAMHVSNALLLVVEDGPPDLRAVAMDLYTYLLLDNAPEDEFHLEEGVRVALHSLLSPLRPLRHAALESLTVLAGHFKSPVKFYKSMAPDRVVDAVEVRLGRHKLPKIIPKKYKLEYGLLIEEKNEESDELDIAWIVRGDLRRRRSTLRKKSLASNLEELKHGAEELFLGRAGLGNCNERAEGKSKEAGGNGRPRHRRSSSSESEGTRGRKKERSGRNGSDRAENGREKPAPPRSRRSFEENEHGPQGYDEERKESQVQPVKEPEVSETGRKLGRLVRRASITGLLSGDLASRPPAGLSQAMGGHDDHEEGQSQHREPAPRERASENGRGRVKIIVEDSDEGSDAGQRGRRGRSERPQRQRAPAPAQRSKIPRSKSLERQKSKSSTEGGKKERAKSTDRRPEKEEQPESPGTLTLLTLQQLSSTSWETVLDGFATCNRLLQLPIYKQDLHLVILSVLNQMQSLRSQVARRAIRIATLIVAKYGEKLEQDCNLIAEKMLLKSADTNKFIRQDALAGLSFLCAQCSVPRLLDIVEQGAGARNGVVRGNAGKMTAQLVHARIGPERSLTEYGNRLMPILVKLLQDGNGEARAAARAALLPLAGSYNFESSLKRHVPAERLRAVGKVIAGIKAELGQPPSRACGRSPSPRRNYQL